jgi:hypothetical protein
VLLISVLDALRPSFKENSVSELIVFCHVVARSSNRFQSRVLPVLFVAALLVVVLSSLGLVRSITLCPLMIFVIKIFLSQLISPFYCLSAFEYDPGYF